MKQNDNRGSRRHVSSPCYLMYMERVPGQHKWVARDRDDGRELLSCVNVSWELSLVHFLKSFFSFTLLTLIIYSCHTTILVSNDDNSTWVVSDLSRVLVNIFLFIFTITSLMILLLIDFLHDDNHHLNATITPNDNNSTQDMSDAIINTIITCR